MKRIESFFLRATASAAFLAVLAACGGHNSSTSGQTPAQPQSVQGVATPSQISVVTAK